jgi:ankyrin repeat protein
VKQIKIAVIFLSLLTPSLSTCMNHALSEAEQRKACSEHLVMAAQDGDLQLVNSLLPLCHVDTRVRHQGIAAIRQAAQNGKLEVVIALTKAHADVNIQDYAGCTPLAAACECGRIDVVRFLLENGARKSIPLRGLRGATPLRQASQSGHENIVTLLLENGAKEFIDTQDDIEMTPVFTACLHGQHKAARALILAKADVTIPDARGYSPIHASCEKGDICLVQILLQTAPLTINAISKGSVTPLHIAAKNGHENIVLLLLQQKADLAIKDIDGVTALGVAKNKAIQKLLKTRSSILYRAWNWALSLQASPADLPDALEQSPAAPEDAERDPENGELEERKE